MFCLLSGLKLVLWRIINHFSNKERELLVFIPHGGCFLDGYGPLNYKSDNALSFFHYIVEKYGNKYKYRIAADCRNYIEQTRSAKNYYQGIDVECFPFFHMEVLTEHDKKVCLRKNKLNVFIKSSFFFASEEFDLPFKCKNQTITILGYYIPFKNDYNLNFLHHASGIAVCTDNYVTTSLLASNIIAHTYGIPLHRFISLGFSRNDNLLLGHDSESYRDKLAKFVDYPVRNIILYTPTHRDYERRSCSPIRGILGIEVEKNRLEAYLRDTQTIIVCKLHSAQMRNIISHDVPMGILLYNKDWNMGLCELMQASNALITDYTSAYFDYLLLDRPIIFNFYDFKKYKEYRGFSFDPLESILAGDIYIDENSFFECLNKVVETEDIWMEKRHFVRDLVHKYQDMGSSARIYDLVLKG